MATPPPSPDYRFSAHPSFADCAWVVACSLLSLLDIHFLVRQRIVVARRGDRRVGFLRVKYYRDFTEVGNAYVIPAERGTRLMWALWAATRPYLRGERVYVIVSRRAAAAMRRSGFRDAGDDTPPSLRRRLTLSRYIGAALHTDYRLIYCEAPFDVEVHRARPTHTPG